MTRHTEMLVDHDTVTRILEETAADEILPRFQKLRDHEVREKDTGELVTVADVAAEDRLTERLTDLLPGSHVVGEEAVAADPRRLETLAREDVIWIIDPIDGTGNFAGGRPVFAVMVALLRAGRSADGWIHDPIGGRTAVAEEASGAWMDGQRLRVAKPAPLERMRGTLHASTFAKPGIARQVQAHRGRVGAIRTLRCAGHEYLRLATGEIHFSLFTKLMPWDHVAGALIHKEAGGVGRTLDGAVYTAHSHGADGLILAPDEAGWRALYGALFDDLVAY